MDFAAPLRARYPDARRFTNLVDGRPCAPEQIVVRTMNFGQHWRTEGIRDVPYRVELPRAYVNDLLRVEAPEYIEDSRLHPDFRSEIDRALEAAGWPDVERVLATPALRNAFTRFYAHDLLLHWFGDGDPPDREPGYVLNTIDGVEIGEDRVTIAGTGRRSGIPVRYQDA